MWTTHSGLHGAQRRIYDTEETGQMIKGLKVMVRAQENVPSQVSKREPSET